MGVTFVFSGMHSSAPFDICPGAHQIRIFCEINTLIVYALIVLVSCVSFAFN